MRVFICWSGSRSREIATALSTWLPTVIGQDLTCGVSTQFQVGERWFPQLLRELERTDAAIVCFTPENLESRWMHFEAGMLFRAGEERVMPYFLGTEPSDIKEPVNAIQASSADLEGTWLLVNALAERGAEDVFEVRRRFDASWPALQREIRKAAALRIDDVCPGFKTLFSSRTFQEPLEEGTDQAWISRYDETRGASMAIRRHLPAVEKCCEPWQLWLYQKLLSQLDGYTLDIRENLIEERRFELSDEVKVDFTRQCAPAAPRQVGAIVAICARRCREIRHVVHCLTLPEGAPQLASALEFAKLSRDQFDDKKRLVQSKGSPVDKASLGLSAEADLEACARSIWDFDRIIYYRIRVDTPATTDAMMRAVDHELHQVEADGRGASKMPLHYAVKAWLSALEQQSVVPFDWRQADRVADGVKKFLDLTAQAGDNDPKIRAPLAEIESILQDRRRGAGS